MLACFSSWACGWCAAFAVVNFSKGRIEAGCVCLGISLMELAFAIMNKR